MKRKPPRFSNSLVNQQDNSSGFAHAMTKKMDVILSSHQRFDKPIEDQNKRTTLLETNMKSMEIP